MAIANPTTPSKPTLEADAEACRRLFGEHPQDIVGTISSAADALLQLHEILGTIAREADAKGSRERIKRLAEAGAHTAFDVGNAADCAREQMQDRLHQAAVPPKTLTKVWNESRRC